MGNTIRWGILGTGMAARAFARGLRHAPGGALVAVGSRNMESAQAFARAHGVPRPHGGYAQLVADPEIDVVYVATPGHRHRDDCLLALNAGKAVLCEKPFALNAGEARDVIEAARKARLFCMEAMWMRFIPLVGRARRMIEEGAIGRVQALAADFAVATPMNAAEARPDLAQGALLNRGVYCLSLASYLLGPPEDVASTATLTASGLDTRSAYLLRFGTGATAMLWASQDTWGSNEATIMGTRGQLRLHEPFYRPHRLSLTLNRPPAADGADARVTTGRAALVGRLKENRLVQKAFRRLQPFLRRPAIDVLEPIEGNGYNYEASEVMRCLRSDKLESEVMPLDETFRLMELMDRIRSQWRP